MKFDYRVFQGPYGLEIRGVFYDYNEVICAKATEGAKPFGETLAELKKDLQRMMDCTDFPVILEKSEEIEEEDEECLYAEAVEDL